MGNDEPTAHLIKQVAVAYGYVGIAQKCKGTRVLIDQPTHRHVDRTSDMSIP